MALYRTADKPSPEPFMIEDSDAHVVSLDQNELKGDAKI